MFGIKKTNKEYFMNKEILEQKEVFQTLCAKYFDKDLNINADEFPLEKWNKIVICASGSSKHAGEIAKYFIEAIANVSCTVEYASEYAHKESVLSKKDLFIAISQSGNTADTFEALLRAKAVGATTLGITNDINSKIHGAADYKVLADAGVEKSIAATKSFTAQLLILYVYAMALAEKIQNKDLTQLKEEFVGLYKKYDAIFEQRNLFKRIARKIKRAKNMAILGRHINSALAQEGSLKIKETCYINAIFSPAGEFMHGHFAFVDRTVPIFALLNKSEGDEENYNLGLNNLLEVKKKRKAMVILFRTEGDLEIEEKIQSRYAVEIPKANKWFVPFLNLAALQLIAFETACLLNDNVDEPRDLIKCVATE